MSAKTYEVEVAVKVKVVVECEPREQCQRALELISRSAKTGTLMGEYLGCGVTSAKECEPIEFPKKPNGDLKVTIDLIEWFEDDIGQYQDRLPRQLGVFDLDTIGLSSDDEIGDKLLDILEAKYGTRPVLIAWNPEDD